MIAQNSPKSAEKSAEDLETQLIQLRKDVSELTTTVKSLATETAQDLRGRVKEKASELADRGRDKLEDVATSVRVLEADTADYVRARPLQAMAIAAGIGLLFGIMTRRN